MLRSVGARRLRLALAPDDLDAAAGFEAEMSVGHDLVAGGDPLLYQHPAGHPGPRRHAAELRGLVRLDKPDEIAARTVPQRRRRNRHAALAGIDRDAAVDKIARPQLQLAVRELRLQLDR